MTRPSAQPLLVMTQPERRAPQASDRRHQPHLDGFMQLSFGRRTHERDQLRACAHWPIDAAARIRAASSAMLELALAWDQTALSPDQAEDQLPGCIDVGNWDSSLSADIQSLQWAGLADQIEVLRLTIRAQMHEHARAAAWLARTVRATRLAAMTAKGTVSCAAVLADNLRVIAKDLLAKDLNALVARLLGHALKVLERLDLSANAVMLDLAGERHYGAVLLTAAEMLDRASTLARESVHFVDDTDRRFRAFRQQVAVVAAQSRQAVSSLAQ